MSPLPGRGLSLAWSHSWGLVTGDPRAVRRRESRTGEPITGRRCPVLCYGAAVAVGASTRRASIVVALLAALCALIVSPPPARAADIAGMTVFLDPGHNGANDSSITDQVPDGRGGVKDCETTGAATNDGYPEHTFTWEVTLAVRDALTAMGVHTDLSRADDTGLGPCIDQRAAAANALAPDAVVSIHGDGGPPWGRGFHVNYASPPLNDVQAGPAVQLATTMRDALAAAGLPPSDYLGSDGLYGRPDLAGLNLAHYPAILVELGNMRNPQDAAQMESPEGRAQYAAAVTNGIVAFLSRPAPSE